MNSEEMKVFFESRREFFEKAARHFLAKGRDIRRGVFFSIESSEDCSCGCGKKSLNFTFVSPQRLLGFLVGDSFGGLWEARREAEEKGRLFWAHDAGDELITCEVSFDPSRELAN